MVIYKIKISRYFIALSDPAGETVRPVSEYFDDAYRICCNLRRKIPSEITQRQRATRGLARESCCAY
jgi:hypothetical protein